MISRLTSIGITGTPLKWFTSYLTNRHHYIKIDNHSSTPRLLTHGVPQGSVIGPILLNIYILPLFKIFRSYPSIKFHAYADDLQIYTNISSHISNPLLLTNCINDISTWLTNNSLSLNFTKTETIKISSPNSLSLAYPTPPVIVSNHSIPFSKNIRNLGFIIDETLSPTQHIRSIARSVNYTLYTIRLIRPFINTDTAITLAMSLARSSYLLHYFFRDLIIAMYYLTISNNTQLIACRFYSITQYVLSIIFRNFLEHTFHLLQHHFTGFQ